ncbi:hypothetical protein B0H13DRAFT_1532531, partial [Mycena leptocephala]
LADAWPHIETLRLCAVCPAQLPRTTLDCLRHLAYSCPRLRTLAIAINYTLEPPVGAASALPTGVSPHQLTQLDVDFSPIYAAIPITAFLALIFP